MSAPYLRPEKQIQRKTRGAQFGNGSVSLCLSLLSSLFSLSSLFISSLLPPLLLSSLLFHFLFSPSLLCLSPRCVGVVLFLCMRCRRGVVSVKSIPPNTEKWLRKLYDENDFNNMSNETKRETNYSMNNK